MALTHEEDGHDALQQVRDVTQTSFVALADQLRVLQTKVATLEAALKRKHQQAASDGSEHGEHRGGREAPGSEAPLGCFETTGQHRTPTRIQRVQIVPVWFRL